MKTIKLLFILLFLVKFCFSGIFDPEIQSPFLQTNNAFSQSSFYFLQNECSSILRTDQKFLKSSQISFSLEDISSSDPKVELMKKIKKRSLISGALFATTMATGYLMSNSDKSPNTMLFTAHKLASVSNLVILDVSVFQKNKISGISLAEKIAAITMNVSFVATMGTGGWMSADKSAPGAVQKIHKITPWLTTISSGILIYLLNNQ